MLYINVTGAWKNGTTFPVDDVRVYGSPERARAEREDGETIHAVRVADDVVIVEGSERDDGKFPMNPLEFRDWLMRAIEGYADIDERACEVARDGAGMLRVTLDGMDYRIHVGLRDAEAIRRNTERLNAIAEGRA